LGHWVTGTDPRAWVCLDRLGHRSERGSSPRGGLAGLRHRRRSYAAVVARLDAGDPDLVALVADLRRGIGSCRRCWVLPHALHVTVAAGLAVHVAPVVGLGLLAGLSLSRLIEALAASGSPASQGLGLGARLLAVVSLGESHRAHHHRFPRSARLSPFEGGFDPGYMVARALARLGLASISWGDLASPAARRIPLPANRVVSVSGPAPV